MTYLVAGLVLFLVTHSVRIYAEDWRAATIRRMGEGPWKAVYSLVSIATFVLLVWGYGQARLAPVDLWMPPPWTRHATALLTLPAFILFAAAYVRGTRIKAAVGHPMVLGVKTWALAHLLSNGRLADVLLFGGFLVWAILIYRAARARDRKGGVTYPVLGASKDVIAVVVGIVAWGVFAAFLHQPLIGVRPY